MHVTTTTNYVYLVCIILAILPVSFAVRNLGPWVEHLIYNMEDVSCKFFFFFFFLFFAYLLVEMVITSTRIFHP